MSTRIRPTDDGTCIRVRAATRCDSAVEATVTHIDFCSIGMSHYAASVFIVRSDIGRHPHLFNFDCGSARCEADKTAGMHATLDGTCHVHVPESGIFHLAEWGNVGSSRASYIDVQRMPITIEDASVRNIKPKTNTINCFEVRIHDGIHIRRTIGFNHQLTELVPVVASAQHIE